MSFPSWERGLKHSHCYPGVRLPLSFPSWERGLKLKEQGALEFNKRVVPLVGTWIETVQCSFCSPCLLGSFPSWERGLKQLLQKGGADPDDVVPLVGTWIETGMYIFNHPSFLSFPSWERGLKRGEEKSRIPYGLSFPSWERGLKLLFSRVCSPERRRSPRGNVD